MSRAVLALIHQDDAGTGVLADPVAESGLELEEASPAQGRPPSRALGEYAAAIVLGGEVNVDQTDDHPWLDDVRATIAELIERRTPLLGVCLGSQLVAEVAGGEVGPLEGGPEIGWKEIELAPAAAGDPLLGGLPPRMLGFQWHSYGFRAPPGAVELAHGAAGLQAYRLTGGPAWGIQFHAEVTAESLGSWLAGDEDEARAAGVDPALLEVQNRREAERWNEVGRHIGRGLLGTISR